MTSATEVGARAAECGSQVPPVAWSISGRVGKVRW